MKLAEKLHQKDRQEMRQAYAEALLKVMKNNPNVLALDCDLSSSVGTKALYKELPDQAFNCGIQESNACGMAAGLSSMGFVPFVHSFAVFTTRRMFDQIFLSCGYAGQNVKLIGGDAGVSAAFNGGTHMAFEDLGLMRLVPNAVVVEASDPVMMKQLVPQIAAHPGVVYLRMVRKDVIRVYDDNNTFTLGKAAVVREGKDVTIIACGIMVDEALKAAEQLAAEGIEARVVDMFTIKPIDRDCVIESAEKTGAIVTAENHNAIGGLGSAVAEVLAECAPVPMERVGVFESFGEVGTQQELMNRFGLTAAVIVDKVKKVISRKK